MLKKKEAKNFARNERTKKPNTGLQNNAVKALGRGKYPKTIGQRFFNLRDGVLNASLAVDEKIAATAKLAAKEYKENKEGIDKLLNKHPEGKVLKAVLGPALDYKADKFERIYKKRRAWQEERMISANKRLQDLKADPQQEKEV